ncbi:hypothetical protein SLEP1_g47378 [Rubroshorea leprosula]|uniref:Uncharacterized protein n=1 Tax=Rubroshorea leprosula TaxID=152421 RepID=A0AAV5LS48_9ROSI|nr:hypothetical protein SLEP1_g47378 [Rubroshorea leprosula]
MVDFASLEKVLNLIKHELRVNSSSSVLNVNIHEATGTWGSSEMQGMAIYFPLCIEDYYFNWLGYKDNHFPVAYIGF